MRRAPLVLTATLASVLGVVFFPVEHAHLRLASGGTTRTTPTTTPTTTPSDTTTPTSTTPTTTPTVRSATGVDEAFQYGDLAVRVTVDGSTITSVTMAQQSETDGRSQQIDAYALPQLEREVLDADSADISAISGATYTSQAFYDSLTSALSQLGFS
jgi:uncharacterized protein with FMN-binding domain